MRRIPWVLIACVSLLALLAWFRPGAVIDGAATGVPVAAEQAAGPRAAAPAPVADGLPAQVAQTRALIEAGGPYPYDRDGMVFGNFEGRLPKRNRGWYREYTVPTPGLDHRGARRIVTGGTPPSEWWYTDDHYETFRRLDR
jgi:guanyl-specific ribonuclease Sa